MVCTDKTGTLTVGQPRLLLIEAVPGADEEAVLGAAAAAHLVHRKTLA